MIPIAAPGSRPLSAVMASANAATSSNVRLDDVRLGGKHSLVVQGAFTSWVVGSNPTPLSKALGSLVRYYPRCSTFLS